MENSFAFIVGYVIDELETEALVYESDGSVSRYGINSKAHPGVDVANLTREEAVDIYQREYWTALRCNELHWPMNLYIFDAAVNQGQTWTRQLRATAHASEEALLLRVSRYWQTATDPDQEHNFHGWIGRIIKLWHLGQQA